MGVVRCGSGARGVGHNAGAGARGRGGVRGTIVLQTGIGRGAGAAAAAVVAAGGAAASAGVVVQGAAAAGGAIATAVGTGNAAARPGVRTVETWAYVASGRPSAPAAPAVRANAAAPAVRANPAATAVRDHPAAPAARPDHAAPAALPDRAAPAALANPATPAAPAVTPGQVEGSVASSAATTRGVSTWRQTVRRIRAERSTSEPTLRHEAHREETNSRVPGNPSSAVTPTQRPRPVGRPARASGRSNASASRSTSRGGRSVSRSSSRQALGNGEGSNVENQVFWLDWRWSATSDGHTVTEDRLRASVEEMRETMMLYGKKWIFQLERGEDSETLHYQGFIQLKERARPRSWASSLNAQYHGISARPSSTNGRDALKNYVMKEDTRVDGPWCDPSMTVYTGEDLPRRESFYT